MKRLQWRYWLLVTGWLCFSAATPASETLAFEGAIGFGQYTVGGNAGKSITVSSLADPPTLTPGTLRWAVTRPFPRKVRFAVSGIIYLQQPLKITGDHITLDGSASPGGIVVAGAQTSIEANQVIIRYLRFRPGQDSPQGDALTAMRRKDIIIDHCSLSWANDEVGSFYNNQNFTLSHSILAHSLKDAGHEKGEHGYGGIWGGKRASFLRNLVANHTSRTPRINGYRLGSPYPQHEALVDIRNNVIFNWGFKSIYGAEGATVNIVNNYFKSGPASTVEWIFELWQNPLITPGRGFIAGNEIVGKKPEEPLEQYLSVGNASAKHSAARLKQFLSATTFYSEPTTLSATEAYLLLIERGDVGATLPFSDSVDRALLKMVRHPHTIKGSGIINSELEIIPSWAAYEKEFLLRAQQKISASHVPNSEGNTKPQ